MKKQIIVTLLLLIATAFVTINYFKNLSPPGMRTSAVMQNIPDDAIIIFQYNNDKSFYDMFKGSPLFTAVAGRQTMGLLDTLKKEVLCNQALEHYFAAQNIFISVYPSASAITELLITATPLKGFKPETLTELSKAKNTGLLITPLIIKGEKGFTIYIKDLKQRFYIIFKTSGILSGSFSKRLIEAAAAYKEQNHKSGFTLPSEQQRVSSLANLYLNYSGLNSLFNRLFYNTDILKSLRLLPAKGALTLNYKSDALMFNGITTLQPNLPASYLNLFSLQTPVDNHLKDIFPSTTAYSINLGISNPVKFEADLSQWQQNSGLSKEKDHLFKQIKSETGINIKKEFNSLLANEFAIVTTRYFEKLGIISLTDGSKMKLLLSHISKTSTNNMGVLSYDKLPFFLLGDIFSIFSHPYYTVADNYLIIANTPSELTSYSDTYLNSKFLNKNKQYNSFDNLLAEKSNVNFLFFFKNAQFILKRDLYPAVNDIFLSKDPSWSSYYAASWQLTAADNNFYTNFCMRLTTDSLHLNSK